VFEKGRRADGGLARAGAPARSTHLWLSLLPAGLGTVQIALVVLTPAAPLLAPSG
jgi:hypothetical protein